MEKILALDLGNQWVGSALSDSLQMFAHPYKTVTARETFVFLQTVLADEPISHVIVGHPRTMKGTPSEQTLLVEKTFKDLQEKFPAVTWILWDERLSSQRAASVSKTSKSTTKEEKNFSHSRAAAFILDSYLGYLRYQKNC